jgi:hypothetical protein
MRRRTAISLGLVGVFALGCGEAGDPTVDTSIDKTRPLTGLDGADAQQLCEDLDAFHAEVYDREFRHSLACMFAAVLAGGGSSSPDYDQAACNEAYDECKAETPDFADPEPMPCVLSSIPPDCNITVGDLVECTEESARLLVEQVDAFACDDPDAQTEQDGPPTPACDRVQTRCPGLVGG